MTIPSGCVKFAVLGVVALVGSASHLELMIGLALPLKEMTEIAFSFYEGKKKKRLRDLCFCIADEVLAIFPPGASNMQAALSQAEWYISKHGVSDREFAELGLDPEKAADTVLKRQKLTRPDEIEIGESTRKLLVCFYDCLPRHPELLQDLLPDIWRALFRSQKEGQDAIKEDIRRLHQEALRISADARASAGIPNLQTHDFYEVKCPATLQEFDAVLQLSNAFFSEGEQIDPDKDRMAFIKNPYSMVVLLNAAGDAVGFIDIYHLPDVVLDAVLEDTTGEVAIDPKECLDYERARACSRAYIATIIVRNERSVSSQRRAQALIYGMMEFLLKHQFYGTDTLELWSIGSTPAGQAILEALDFCYDRMVVLEPNGEDKPAFRRRLRKEELINEQAEFFVRYDLRDVVLNVPPHP